MSPRLARTLTALGATVLVAGGAALPLTQADAAPSHPAAPHAAAAGPRTGAPRPGTCYDIPGHTAYAATATSAHTIPCSRAHTLWVTAAPTVPRSVPLDPDNQRFQRFASRACGKAETHFLHAPGLSAGRAKSAYFGFDFLPTRAQRRAGARWLSCDTGVLAGHSRLSRTRDRHALAVNHLPQRLRLCGDNAGYLTNCGGRHRFRATTTRVLSAPRSSQARGNRAVRACRAALRGRTQIFLAPYHVYGHRMIAICMPQDRH